MSENPYAAPRAAVADVLEPRSDGDFLEEPRAVPAGNGWQWVRSAWVLFKEAPLLWFVFLLIAMGMGFAFGMVPIVGNLAQYLFMPFLLGGIALFADGIRAGRGADIGNAFSAVPAHAQNLLILGLIYLAGSVALIVAAFLPFFGLAGFGFALGRPGGFSVGSGLGMAMLLYFVLALPFMMATYFAPMLIVLQNKAPLDAMRLSFKACLRNILPFLVFIAAVIGLAIAATLPLLLGWFVLAPLLFATGYSTYRDVFFDH